MHLRVLAAGKVYHQFPEVHVDIVSWPGKFLCYIRDDLKQLSELLTSDVNKFTLNCHSRGLFL